MTYRSITSGLVLACALSLTAAVAAAQDNEPAAQPAAPPAPKGPPPELERFGAVVQAQLATDKEAQASQDRINKLDDETQKLLSEYRKAVADAESYTAYAKNLEVQIKSQQEELAEIERQLLEVETTSREVTPLMQRMLDTLEQFVSLDVPFLLEERTKRVTALKDMMSRADVTISEKYRRIVEAYQVEMDYGRTIEAYESKLGSEDDARTVQFLRVGRIALLYQTLDGDETGYWDAEKKDWVVDNDYSASFKEGIGVAKKARAPEMLIVPVPAPKEAKS
jgi:hypothetical protein